MKHISLTLLVALAFGCSNESKPAPEKQKEAAPSGPQALPDQFWAKESPEGAVDVFDLREGDLNGKEVVVRGTVQEFVDGFAAFVLVEDTLLSCNEIPGDECETPWDYCCADPDELTRGSAFVEFHDGDSPGSWAVEGFHGIAQLSEVVVTGTLQVDDANNLSVQASSIRLQ